MRAVIIRTTPVAEWKGKSGAVLCDAERDNQKEKHDVSKNE